MRIATILGSPRKNGNTAKVLSLFEEQMTGEHEVYRVNVATCDIRGCVGCHACQGVPDAPGCVQKDGAAEVFDRLMNSDGVVYSTGLYCWGFTSQMKALLDRHFCLVTGYDTDDYRSLLQDKKVALLVTCAGPVEDNADLIQTMFERIADFARCTVVGKYIVPFCTTPDAMGDAAADVARNMAEQITATQ